MAFDLLPTHARDLGSFTVKRALPSAIHKMVGPFIFFDHMGPATMAPGQGMDVRPHPHIGLATVTYLFQGSGLHRDSLGTVQRIDPGDVNWMVAGRGVVHSERTPAEDLDRERILHGIQIWVALPSADEQVSPSFSHHAAASLPTAKIGGATICVILGRAFGMQAPPLIFSPCCYAHAILAPGAELVIAPEYPERAIYAVDNDVRVEGQTVPKHTMAVFEGGSAVTVTAPEGASLMLLCGTPMDGERYLNWNFVASSRELIAAARTSWTGYPNSQFGQVPDEVESIPLPP